LNESRIVARRDDAAEIACIAGNDLPVWKEACCGYGVEVANRVGEVNMVEEIENSARNSRFFDSPTGTVLGNQLDNRANRGNLA